MPFIARNPATEEFMYQMESLSDSGVEERIRVAHEIYLRWRETSISARAEVMRRVAQELETHSEQIAFTITTEMGKPIQQAIAEVQKTIRGCHYFAEHAEAMLAPIEVLTEARKSYVSFQPLGVLLAIMPWNFPVWQAMRFAIPAIMAGNVVLLKPAPTTPGSALRLTDAFHHAYELPLMIELFAEVEQIEAVICHPLVRGVTFTGSTRAGRAVARIAGDALKKCVLELGGSDPAIVLPDADLDKTVEQIIQGRFLNTGQSCIAIKRVLVDQALYEPFVERVLEQCRTLRMSNPLDPTTDLGPLARADLRENLHRQVRESIEMGAQCLLGGEMPEGVGYFYPPTVLTEVTPGMPVWQEETFGPVLPITKVSSRYEAVQLANETVYGLGASVYTENIRLGEEIARDRLEAGNCFVNQFVFSDPRLPFGGIKESGFGRELGTFGIHEFTNIKTVYIR
ncbi:MAG: NAD-dependent succinate-semialdehyde dehydrogenase [Fimbriimonadales bacterium]